ncbi:hypothetical protein FisN_24Lh144 [Fistulifera solaris]|uniref:Cationic amino acid transporter C-terminal domain-containing protein n=1 Tax=Fistulifera solaris TaxID=1519565 RepID=A0A1Z5K9A3_FISSO|nr:hypothetical protein FisN_24Lh144 [Fistulifera solaris]|eukprot:GAX22859.1 hypothetical protein FisN_24Lh144 [Fistulifera solaris]
MSISPNSPWIRKPLHAVYQHDQNEQQQLHRHLTVWDLLGIGVGGTVGSGIFVLTGQIAAQYAGTWTWCSFAVSGLAATCSGVCFAELSGRIPAAGSSYAYAYVCFGQLAAIVAAACLTLEYGIAGAAVARSWGDKVLLVIFSGDAPNESSSSSSSSLSSSWMNVPALLISALSTLLLVKGVKESKTATNFITMMKMLLVFFMIVGGFWLSTTRTHNNSHQSSMPTAGILRGATSSFFGYLGYDEVCCVAGEAKNPVRDMPRAVLGTLGLVTITYVTASIALTSMVEDPQDISPTSGFPSAFRSRHVEWAAEIAAWGEIVTLPVVVLISLLAQPRLTYGMAQDGLLPAIFAQTDVHGNLVMGTFIQGTAMTLLAAFVPFTYLNDLISAGILVAFSLTDASLVVLRRESPPSDPGLLERYLIGYNVLCFLTAILVSHETWWVVQTALAVFTALSAALTLVYMTFQCPASTQFGGTLLHCNQSGNVSSSAPFPDSHYFQTPWVPLIPCLGMAVNWYLIAQLEVFGLLLLGLYLGVVVLLYLIFCLNGTAPSWAHQTEYVSKSSSSEDAISLISLGHHNFDNEKQSMLSEQDEILNYSSAATRNQRLARRNSR